MMYYMIINGKPEGPFPKETLLDHGLQMDTYVWREGLQDWVMACKLSDIGVLFIKDIKIKVDHYGPGGQYGKPTKVETLTPPFNFTDQSQRSGNRNPQQPSGNQEPPYTDYGSQNSCQSQDNYGQQQYGSPYGSASGYGQPGNNGKQYGPVFVRNHYNWLPLAIAASALGFIFSCVGGIFGIIAIVNANKANELYAMGFEEAAKTANKTAKIMTIISLVLGGIGCICFLNIFFFGGFGTLFGLSL